jgi:DNA-binding transcriptional LysR family regulator
LNAAITTTPRTGNAALMAVAFLPFATSVLGGGLRRAVDVAFTRLHPGQSELEVEILGHEPRLVALAAGHPLAHRRSLTFADLRHESFIVNPVISDNGTPPRWLAEQRRHGLPGRIAATSTSLQEILTLVAAKRSCTRVPTSPTCPSATQTRPWSHSRAGPGAPAPPSIRSRG